MNFCPKKIFLVLIFVSFAVYAGKDCEQGHNSNCNHSQSANTTCRDFANILNFAKYSACENVINKFEYLDKGFGKFIIKKLESNTKDLFPWRFEVTNGYQEGFFYHALMGIALENKDDIISAYNEFCSSLSYIDEEKSFNHPELRHEIELAIAKIYLEIGRLNDAQEWFESVRIESSDNNSLVAADLGLIACANAVGDINESFRMYDDLGTLRALTRKEHNDFARLLFVTGNNEKAFSLLLNGLAKYGFVPNQGAEDPIIKVFLNALPRATDEDINYFYDLLGWAIKEAQMKKGDEKYIAFLAKTRFLLCSIFPFLHEKNDFDLINKRLEFLKTNFTYTAISKQNETIQSPLKKHRRLLKQIKFKNNTKGKTSLLPELVLENILNRVLLSMKANDLSSASKLLNEFKKSLTNEAWKEIKYDDTTFQQFSYLADSLKDFSIDKTSGIQEIVSEINKFNNKLSEMPYDDSELIAEICLRNYGVFASQMFLLQKMCGVKLDKIIEPTQFIKVLKETHPYVLLSLTVSSISLTKDREFEKAFNLFEKYYNCLGTVSPNMYYYWILGNIACGNMEKASELVYEAFLKLDPFSNNPNMHSKGWFWFRRFGINIASSANDDTLIKFDRVQLLAEATAFLINYQKGNSTLKLRTAIHWKDNFVKLEQKLRTEFDNGNFSNVLMIIQNNFNEKKQYSHLVKQAVAFAAVGNTNKAFSSMMKAYKKRNSRTEEIGGVETKYPNLESPFLESYLTLSNTNNVTQYIDWLSKLHQRCLIENKTKDANLIKQTLEKVKKNYDKK